MTKPDKLPLIDPRVPDLYARIIEAAEKVRRERQAESSLAWAAIRYKLQDDLRNVNRPEDGPVIWVAK